jgi:hypothetical protein
VLIIIVVAFELIFFVVTEPLVVKFFQFFVT